MTIAILGAGAFGTALAISLARKEKVLLWARDASALVSSRQSPRLPGAHLPDTVEVVPELDLALAAQTLLFAVPMQGLASFAKGIAQDLSGKALVACCKGVDLASLQGPTAVLASRWPGADVAILTGPSFATDIAAGLPTALTLACENEARGQSLQHQLSTPDLRLYRTTDVIGAELGGALKNVIAIAAGFVIGAGLGDSARAALMTRGFAEMTRLAARLGARAETLMGLSGLGDLVLTCTSDQSRNFRHGCALGRGVAPNGSQTVEGVATAEAMLRRAKSLDFSDMLPVTQMVAMVTQGHVGRDEAISRLMTRPLKEE